ncbi:MAG: single-stranded DNA-binding protein [Bacteroidetes bacterium]|nr:single-stranded DNA-binding protein [Bacteroidota bacterium]MCB9225923.1 single-stranded DNA-binding protein [Chitinophagales bacterium]
MINKVTLIGRLGKDPEVRHFDNNSAVCNFTLATNETYTDRDGNRIEQTEWHNLAIWRKGLIDVAEKYLGKGQLIYVEGKLRTRSWEDQNGAKRYSTEVVVDNFKMLERKDDSGQNQTSQSQQSSNAQNENTTPPTTPIDESPMDDNDEANDLPF